MDPDSQALKTGLADAKDGAEKARLAQVERDRREREAAEAAAAARKEEERRKEAEMSEDDLMAGFFGDLDAEEEKRAEEKRKADNEVKF